MHLIHSNEEPSAQNRNRALKKHALKTAMPVYNQKNNSLLKMQNIILASIQSVANKIPQRLGGKHCSSSMKVTPTVLLFNFNFSCQINNFIIL